MVIIHDNPAFCIAMLECLEAADYHCKALHTLTNGQALQRRAPFDIVVIDIAADPECWTLVTRFCQHHQPDAAIVPVNAGNFDPNDHAKIALYRDIIALRSRFRMDAVR